MLPFLIAGIGLVYVQLVLGIDMAYWILAVTLILVFLYISMPYIDHWFLKRNPIILDPKIIDWLSQHHPFYQALSTDDKEKFESRLATYLSVREFKAIGKELRDVPIDLKGIIASNGIQVTFGQEDFLLKNFNRIFVYKHPFPSPRFKFLHTVETQIEDGVIIFSLEQLLEGLLHPNQKYNIGTHGYIEAWTKLHPNAPYPDENEYSWEDIKRICGFGQKMISATTGYPSVDKLIVILNCYFTHSDQFESTNPQLFEKIKRILG